MSIPSRYKSLKLFFRQHHREFLTMVPGQSDDAPCTRELNKQPCVVPYQKRTLLLTKNACSVHVSREILAH